MGMYLNCGNEAFRQIRNGTYVDKTGLIDYINQTIDTARSLTCFSRPRRFGKSFAAAMLAAYYDKSCDSGELFDGLEISHRHSYKKYLNAFDVIYLDITWFISVTDDICDVLSVIQRSVIEELREAFPDYVKADETILANAILNVSRRTNEKFFLIIDEWDALFREVKHNDELQKSYLRFLRGLFKGGPSMKSALAGAYMTGILPIKKYGTESALTDFEEYSMTNPDMLSEYVGFTEEEVRDLCLENEVDFEKMKRWYDGYSFEDHGCVYSPDSVMSAVKRKRFRNYWTGSETYESLKSYISMNFDGLKDAIVAMLGGGKIKIEIARFQNDITSFNSKDDVLTLLIHLGYLGYHEKNGQVYIPNLEIAGAFQNAVEGDGWEEIASALASSEDLLQATINEDSAAVETALERVHDLNVSVLQYNDENSLSCAVTLAYYTARNYYTIVREFPSGKGFADLAFIPAPHVDKPALLIELKYNQTADGAIRQIRDRRYDGALQKYTDNLLLVGINYNKNDKGKKHTCIIERFR
ncbi:MAG: ATP-binding protein [Clostridiales bacterium]|nr:ATP-binding protein [Clostridiales bacterium]